MISVAAALREGAAVLAAAGIDDPRREARLLLHAALGVSERTFLAPEGTFDPVRFETLLARRAAREPLAFVRGHQGFWTLDLEVAPCTLIPRADSETLVHAALAAFPERARVRTVLDLGTGTGALLLAALAEFSAAWGVGVDLSPAAVALAARNARANGLSARASFVCADWAAPLGQTFDLILANPPYIPSPDMFSLMPEVALHEPRSALDGGADGLDEYRKIIAGLPGLLAPGGVAILELGQGQAESVAAVAAVGGFGPPVLREDLGGIARAMTLRVVSAKKMFGRRVAGG
jgi:release factor glutamine methyltransferase